MGDENDRSNIRELVENIKNLIETASEERLRVAMDIVLAALDEYATENADLDTALAALRCRAILADNNGNQEAAE